MARAVRLWRIGIPPCRIVDPARPPSPRDAVPRPAATGPGVGAGPATAGRSSQQDREVSCLASPYKIMPTPRTQVADGARRRPLRPARPRLLVPGGAPTQALVSGPSSEPA